MSREEDLAAALAAEAGECLLALRGRDVGGGEALGARADAAAHRLLVTRLAEATNDPVVSEEGDLPAFQIGSRFWLVDPLDGTREYAEPGRSDWAVHVALIEHGVAIAGAVALPARGLVLSSARPPQIRAVGVPLRLVVSRSRPPTFADDLASAVGATITRMGSAGAKTAAVVLGDADAYVHAGGQHEWDSAAPVAVAQASGLHVSRLDGSTVRYGNPAFELPDIVIANPCCAERVLEALRRLTNREQGFNAAARDAGAQGSVLKTGNPIELLDAPRAVFDGNAVADPHHPPRPGRSVSLTRRQREVLELVAHGHSNAEIAHELAIGGETVKTQLNRTFHKLEVHTRAHAVAVARQLALI